jgi:hypothetical protein
LDEHAGKFYSCRRARTCNERTDDGQSIQKLCIHIPFPARKSRSLAGAHETNQESGRCRQDTPKRVGEDRHWRDSCTFKCTHQYYLINGRSYLAAFKNATTLFLFPLPVAPSSTSSSTHPTAASPPPASRPAVAADKGTGRTASASSRLVSSRSRPPRRRVCVWVYACPRPAGRLAAAAASYWCLGGHTSNEQVRSRHERVVRAIGA